MAVKLGAQADTLVGLFVARQIRCDALGYQELLYRQVNCPKPAEQARKERKAEYDLVRGILAGRERTEPAWGEMGFLESRWATGLPTYHADMAPVRRAEQFLIAELGLFVVLAGLILLAVWLGLSVAADRLVIPRASRGVLVFVGWARLGRILLLGVAAPLGAYTLYVTIASLCTGAIGLTLGSLGRVVVELAAVGAVVLGLVVGLSRSAIRQRAAEFDPTVPPAPTWRDRAILWALTAAVALAVIAYLIGWWTGLFRRVWPSVDGDTPAKLLVMPIGSVLILWGLRPWVAGLWHDPAPGESGGP